MYKKARIKAGFQAVDLQHLFGRDDRIWTCDHHTPSVVRYQTALRPDYWFADCRNGANHTLREVTWKQPIGIVSN